MPVEAESVEETGEQDEEQDEVEAQEPVRRAEVYTPSTEEVRRHNITHMPHRSWCPQCVAGRSKDDAHRKRHEPEEGRGPEVHYDYAFLRNKEGGEQATVLVGRCRRSKFLVAYVVPSKGVSEEWVAEEIVKDLKTMGHHGRVILRGDQEPALNSLFERVAEIRGSVTVPENAPKGDSKGNGFAERAVQQLEEMVRVLKLALENAVGQRVAVSHPCMAWLVKHAVDIVNRYLVMADGTTAYQRLKLRKCTAEMHPFATPILHRVSGAVQGGVVAERFYEGLWLGKTFKSNEDLVNLDDGQVVRSRSTKERPTTVKLTMEMLDKVVAPTWKPTSTISDSQPLDRRTPEEEGDPEVVEAADRTPYRVKLTKVILEQVGYTPSCSKCAALKAGDKARTKSHTHTEACRTRVEAEMKKHEPLRKMVEAMTERQNEWLAKQVEKEDKKGKKTGERTKDYWKIDDYEVTRVHVTPRTALFTPSGSQCPVPVKYLSERRMTRVQYVNDMSEELLGDDWTLEDEAHRELEGEWTGGTTFRVADEEHAEPHAPGPSASGSGGSGAIAEASH